jgi:hypothetical protein
VDAYILSLLHFNIQYCAGGTAGISADTDFPSDDASVQDQTIVESFDPVLTMLEAHPSWHMDFEMQAYMVEILAERHPESLTRLRALAKSGQVELVSFHYSDQLFVAFPWRDEQKSLELTQEVFAANDLPLSDVVFTQEGQFGEGMLQRMPEFGYHTAVLPHNLASAVWGAESPQATWKAGDVNVLIGGAGYATASYTVGWHFLNDGELYATDDKNCYLGASFRESPEAMEAHAAELQAAEDSGAKIATIGEFTAAHGADHDEPMPDMVDGTWQPDNTDNLGLWMGGMGIFSADEDDLVRVLNARASRQLAAAELVDGAGADQLDEGWRELLLGEVSDASGWNPLAVEVAYGKDHSSTAYELANSAIADACPTDASWLHVNVATGAVTPDGHGATGGGDAAEAPFTLAFSAADDTDPMRTGTATWTTTADADVLALTVHLDASGYPVKLVFPWDGEEYATIPALTETMRELPATSVAMDPIGLPLALGVFRVAEGVWVIQKTDSTHLAGIFSKAAGTVTFFDETGSADARTHEYRVVLGTAARATEVALALNATPEVDLVCAPGDTSADLPCGCQTGGDAGSVAGAMLALCALVQRRRGGGNGR